MERLAYRVFANYRQTSCRCVRYLIYVDLGCMLVCCAAETDRFLHILCHTQHERFIEPSSLMLGIMV